MAAKKSKKAGEELLPKQLGGVKVPKALRRQAHHLVELARSPLVADLLAAGLVAIAAKLKPGAVAPTPAEADPEPAAKPDVAAKSETAAKPKTDAKPEAAAKPKAAAKPAKAPRKAAAKKPAADKVAAPIAKAKAPRRPRTPASKTTH